MTNYYVGTMGKPCKAKAIGNRLSKEEWRRYGAARRKELVSKDETLGGTRFEMHKKIQIERYFRVAEKAFSDFQKKCKDEDSDVEETYVMGHRLTAFVGKALPQHPSYRKSQVTQMRHRSQRNLEWVKEQMEILALKIDEEQLNSYITNDYDPAPDDFSSSSSEADDEQPSFADFSSMGDLNDQTWQDFTGSSFPEFSPNPFPYKDIPVLTETDSSHSHDANSSHEDLDFDEQPDDETDMSDYATDEEEERSKKLLVEEPKTIVTFQDDDESQQSSYLDGGPSEFFLKIASEAAHSTAFYESDSEAADSWAQDGESCARSCASSDPAISNDSARLAFREIINNAERDTQLLSQPNLRAPAQDLPPKSVLKMKQLVDNQTDRCATSNIVSF